MGEVKRLPRRTCEVVILRAWLLRYEDVAEVFGIRTGPLAYVMSAVDTTLRQMPEKRAERERPVASLRAVGLRELEENTLEWLIEAVGRLPIRRTNASATVLAWRRVAPAIGDHRCDRGWTSVEQGL